MPNPAQAIKYSFRSSGEGPPYWSVIAAADGSEIEASSGSVFSSWNPAGPELATLRSTLQSGWTLELREPGQSANALAKDLEGPDSWSWCAEPKQLAFANADGVFVSELRGNRRRVLKEEASRLRFLRTTPGISACPRVSGKCDSF